jgi:trafficking protein particle complex subunit 10
VLTLAEDNESLLARHIVIPVEVPEIQVVHTAELRLFTDSEATTTITPYAAVGHMVPAELTLRHTRRWYAQPSEKQDSAGPLEFSYEMHVNQDLWLLGGRRRGHFSAQEGEVKKFAVMLLPQKSGHLLLPSIEIKTFVVGGTAATSASAANTPTPTPTTNTVPSIALSPAATATATAPWTQQRRQIPNEVDYKNHGETLLVLPDLRKTTVSLESGNPGLIESEARVAA